MNIMPKLMFGQNWKEDPVFEKDGYWYYCDETWNETGPYINEKCARRALFMYCTQYLGENFNKEDYEL